METTKSLLPAVSSILRLAHGGQPRSRADYWDLEPPNRADLSQIWLDLVRGSARAVDHFCTEQRAYLVLEDARPGARCVTPREVDVLRRVLLGQAQKVVASELGVGSSTIALLGGEALRRMGLDSGASRVPVLLAISAHASAEQTQLRQGRRSEVVHEDRTYSVFSAERPDAALNALLSPAECAVTRLLVEGRTHGEIAEQRATSSRTVANQLTASFHKLGVSGRTQLLSYLIRHWRPELPAGGVAVAAALPEHEPELLLG